MEDVFFTVGEVAGFLQVNKTTVRRYIRCGRLKALKLNRGYRIGKGEYMRFIGDPD